MQSYAEMDWASNWTWKKSWRRMQDLRAWKVYTPLCTCLLYGDGDRFESCLCKKTDLLAEAKSFCLSLTKELPWLIHSALVWARRENNLRRTSESAKIKEKPELENKQINTWKQIPTSFATQEKWMKPFSQS